jgi:hypothetical protein
VASGIALRMNRKAFSDQQSAISHTEKAEHWWLIADGFTPIRHSNAYASY